MLSTEFKEELEDGMRMLVSPFEGQKVLGDIDEIKRVFVDFQQHLYSEKVA